jgi:hypothetical protein
MSMLTRIAFPAVGALAVLLPSISGTAMAYEEPAFELLKTYDRFELRRYAPRIVAETVVRDSFEDAGNRAFRILAGYIGGKNAASTDISMTAPVTQETAGQQIDMAAPVTQQRENGAYVVRFVMPSEFTLDTLPGPLDPRVELRELPAQTFAALKYRGGWGRRLYEEKEAILYEGIREAGMKATGTPVWARYNSPFMIWFLRRNEILIEVEPPGELREAGNGGG